MQLYHAGAGWGRADDGGGFADEYFEGLPEGDLPIVPAGSAAECLTFSAAEPAGT